MGGQALYWGDLSLYFYPLAARVSEALRSGRLPLWNPYVLCGQPLLANPQSSVLYPTTALLPVVPPWLHMTLNAAIHLFAGGVGAYLLLLRLARDRWGALLGAIAYAGSGYMVARLQFPPMVQSAAYLPWLLVFADRAIARASPGRGALLALATALCLIAGHPQVAYMSLGATAAFVTARLLRVRAHGGPARAALWRVVGWTSIGAAAALVQLIPSAELLQHSAREDITLRQANRFVFLPEHLVNFVAPGYFGDPAHGNFWGVGNRWEPCVYQGLVPLALAAWVTVRLWRRAAVAFFAWLGIVGVWLAFGRYGGLYLAAYYVVPGVAKFHDPARFTFLATIAISALAALGMRALRERGAPRALRIVLVVATAADLAWFGAHTNPGIDPVALAYRPSALAAAPTAEEGRAFTAERQAVWDRYLSYADYGPDSAQYAHELADTLAPNIGMRFGVAEASGYEPVPIRRVTEVDSLVRDALERRSASLGRLLALFNARLLLLPEATRYAHPDLRPRPASGVRMLAVRDPAPRAWLVRRTRRVDGDARSLAAIASPEFRPRREAIVSDAPGLPETLSAGDANAAPVSTAMRPAGYALGADCGDRPAFLVISAACYPGWAALVDGAPGRLIRTNHAFLGIALGPGNHRVELAYQPQTLRAALYCALAGLGAIVVGLTAGLCARPPRRRRPRVPGAEDSAGLRRT
ncbi:MAG: YfhO family protein [Chthonomonadales bacterium]|nr:YfhO family protein [Chthonomonadales bacterium]